jgi:hypothetical protein
MPHLFQNVNVSVRVADQLPFLQYLAAKDRGAMSRYIRKLIDTDPEYRAWKEVYLLKSI